MLRGVWTALVTPFRDGQVDEAALRHLLRQQTAAGVHGVVLCGSTGEAATLSRDERRRVNALGIEACAGTGTQAWVGTGTNDTRTSIELTCEAQGMGAAGAMVVAPYYNKPTQEGLYQHFAAVARACDLPLILYNVPGRTGVNVLPETAARLAALGRYAAIKEASGSLDQVSDIRARCDLTVLSGDDSLTLPMLAVGATGVVSVVSNLLPRAVRALVDAFQAGRVEEARLWHFRLWPFFKGAFIETNPAPIKMWLELAGLASAETRLPLVPASATARAQLGTILQAATWRQEAEA